MISNDKKQEVLSRISEIENFTIKRDGNGKRYGVGPGVVGNIKLNLGEPVIKLDRHVIGVMKKFLQLDIPLNRYNEFARVIGMDARYLDCILFEYGKSKKISAGVKCAAVMPSVVDR